MRRVPESVSSEAMVVEEVDLARQEAAAAAAAAAAVVAGAGG